MKDGTRASGEAEVDLRSQSATQSGEIKGFGPQPGRASRNDGHLAGRPGHAPCGYCPCHSGSGYDCGQFSCPALLETVADVLLVTVTAVVKAVTIAVGATIVLADLVVVEVIIHGRWAGMIADVAAVVAVAVPPDVSKGIVTAVVHAVVIDVVTSGVLPVEAH
ncbi:hypothetical protein NDU88_005634 [Pleurodeles waltl]|uniref:Uncharacterized protein n=1 Tax=Pleurodeles waltl TaxID=8319 RepID=A0AAV7QFT7_PLEWA|nr:hypothetical protein NDU88_005634 [Pleurodeles waltl]